MTPDRSDAVNEQPPLRLERTGPVARVILDRPEQRNAFDDRLAARLREAFEALATDAEVRVVMLEGTGEAECCVTGIPYTEAVTVGDTVISADINCVRGPRLFFGTVTSAEFLAGGQWDVRIKPGFTIAELDEVGIDRMSLRPETMTMTDSKPTP